MELAHSLVLNEQALAQIPEQKQPVFVYEWLRFLDKVLIAAHKSDIKNSQQKIVEQMVQQITAGPGPPTRQLLGRCLATIFCIGDTFALFSTINTCNDILKSRDDSPSHLPTRLAAITSIGAMYEKLGRMVGRSFEETTQILVRSLKNAESQSRTEIMLTFEKMVLGLGNAGQSVYKDVYKAAKLALVDRVMPVRCAAAKCLEALVKEAPFLWTAELESIATAAFKAFEGSTYEVRCAVAQFLGVLLAAAHDPKATFGGGKSMTASQSAALSKALTLEECLQIISTGFLKGGGGILRGSANVVSGVAKEVRVGSSLAYVEFVKTLGSSWFERNVGPFIRFILDLAAAPKITQVPHPEIIYIRRCVSFILRMTVGKLLGEKSQYNACKEIGQIIAEQMNSIDISMDASMLERNLSAETSASQHLLFCALQELASLARQIGTALAPLFVEASGIMEPIFATLLHPCLPVQLACAWCLRNVTAAVPSLTTPLIDRCLSRLEHLKTAPDAITGYSLAIAALLGGAYESSLGIPHAKGRQIFTIGEDLLRTATQSSRLTLVKTKAGWLLLSSVIALGPSVVKHHLPRLLLLWKNAFPRSAKEAEAEKQRGDQFTWQVTMEARAGALCAIQSFFTFCGDLVTDDVVRRMLVPIDAALTMLAHAPAIVKQHNSHQLKTAAASMRFRLYSALMQLKAKHFESCFAQLLRELVAEFTLTDNTNVLTTSLLQEMCHHDDSIILGTWLQQTDHSMIEDEAQTFQGSAIGTLEQDHFTLCARDFTAFDVPSPLPLSIAVIDASVRLFGNVFPLVPSKHRLQMLKHFGDCVNQAKGPRQQAMQMNIFTALLCSLKQLAEQKGSIETDEVRKAALNLILPNLGSQNPVLRCAAAEALGRIAQVVGDPRFVAELAQYSFDKLKTCRDVTNRTGHSLALGCLHRYVGGLGSGQHLNTSVSILLALSQENSSPIVQVWALHALGLIADSGGPMFRSYVEPALSLVLKLLLSVPSSNTDVHQCVGKLTSALITTVGPELQNNVGAIVATRCSFQAACAMMVENPDALVQSEAVACLQQLHMFAPRHVDLATLVPQLCIMMQSPHLILRKAAVACLRQLAQREAKEVRDHAQVLIPEGQRQPSQKKPVLPETGLEGALFQVLDVEHHKSLIENVHDTLISLVQCLAAEQLTFWMGLCKEILASSAADTLTPAVERMNLSNDAAADAEEVDDDEVLRIGGESDSASKNAILPRWPTRVFTMEVVRKIVVVCEAERAHFDLALAKELQLNSSKSDYLVLHLSDLIRLSFMGATSETTELRLVGLAALQDVINKFAKVPEPEFPGHVILEQFQAQVGAALRPAFSPDTPSHVTAAACQVCSTWIGSGVARDLNDLRRVHQLLVSSLAKLKKGSISTQLYNESAATLEKIAILKAWAEVYITAMEQDKQSKENGDEYQPAESLLSLVTSELAALIAHWLAALKDYALLSLPHEFSNQLPSDGGAFYTPECVDAVRPYYKQSWAPLLLAVTTWLSRNDFEVPEMSESTELPKEKTSTMNFAPKGGEITEKDGRFFLIMGICLEAVCGPRSQEPIETVRLCLRTLKTLLECEFAQGKLMSDVQLGIELLSVMHRVILTRECLQTQQLCMDVMDGLLAAAETNVKLFEKNKLPENAYRGGEGSDAKLEPGKSLVYSAMEVCLCCLVRQIPQVNPAVARSKSGLWAQRKYQRLAPEAHHLIVRSLQSMIRLPNLCSQEGALVLLPTVLFLITGTIRETSKLDTSQMVAAQSTGNISAPAAGALQCLRTVVSQPIFNNENEKKIDKEWAKIVQSTLLTVLSLKEQNDCTVDPIVLLLATAVFLNSAPYEVTASKNVQSGCIQLFTEGLKHSELTVQQKALQTVQSIFVLKDQRISAPYIIALTPVIVDRLQAVLPENGSKIKDIDELESAVLLEAEKCLDFVLASADSKKRLPIANNTVHLLMKFVEIDAALVKSSKPIRLLCEQTLQRLTRIGTVYPEEFKQILAARPDFRNRLETALRSAPAVVKKSIPTSAGAAGAPTAQPSIKLTMDFSAFAKK